MRKLNPSPRPFRVLQIGVLVAALLITFGIAPAQSAVPHLGYGFNLYADVQGMLDMGFDWLKVFYNANPAIYPATLNILYRLVAKNSDLTNVTAFGDEVANVASQYKDSIDAYEIGNEVNIDNPDYGWGAPPNASNYKLLLCEAYTRIKAADPTAIVVSAGLAPTGRVQGTWNGHLGHNGLYQDDREFLKELFNAGGGACLDAVGYHPYGFSADYNATPDVASGDPTQNCDQGFCFRGTEMIYEIMQQMGLGDKKIWATEMGWITAPPDNCLSDPSWSGRQWQIVSDDKQASNLAGAFQYADANWPWMGAMLIFNFDFNENPGLSACDQMRFYSVKGKPAAAALQNIPKNKANITGRLRTETTKLTWLVDVDQQPVDLPGSVDIANWGWGPVVYTATVNTSADVAPVIDNPTGPLSPTAQSWINLNTPGFTHTLGTYTGTLTVNWFAPGAQNNQRSVALEVRVLQDVQRVFLPLVMR